MRVLFVARAGDRRGDKQVLLTFLRWLHDDDIEPVVVLGGGGPTVPDFEQVAETHVLGRAPHLASASSSARRAYNHVIGAWCEVDRRRSRKRLGAFDLVYVNGLGGAAVYVNRLELPDEVPILTHVHEHTLVLRAFEREASGLIGRTDHFVAVSPTTAAALHDEHHVAASAISTVRPLIDVEAVAAQRSDVGLRKLAGIDGDVRIVGGAGIAEWRKGPDLFVQVAREVAKRRGAADVAFVWVGQVSDSQRTRLEHDIAGLGVDNVHFIGEHPNGPALFREFDVLCLPSHEDPFSCVALESAAGAVPVVRFRGADGREVFGSRGGARIVDYLDVPAMGAAVNELLADPERRRALGEQAKQCAQGFDVRILGPRVVEVIKATARSPRTPRLTGTGQGRRQPSGKRMVPAVVVT
jgi:glycosyltransferase involved in cell wall biosynthesis